MVGNIYFDARSDISELESIHPNLADRFQTLRTELDLPNKSLALPYQSTKIPIEQPTTYKSRYAETVKEFNEIIMKIRGNRGFKRFLLGISIDEFKYLASDGPIVFLNASPVGCNAFIITRKKLSYVELNELKYEDLVQKHYALWDILKSDDPKTREHNTILLIKILEWLWDSALDEILDHLKFFERPKSDDAWPRIWWVPVGLFRAFPIHAAGYHLVPGRNVLDRVVSSYTYTVEALNSSRRKMEKLSHTTSQTILVATMPTTPSKSDIKSASVETGTLRQVLPLSNIILQEPVKPTKSTVVTALRDCAIAHFACHTKMDPFDPSKTQIFLDDWETNHFTIADITSMKFDKAQMAYISGCQFENGNYGQVNEVSLAENFQLAGFPTIIGTLWQNPNDDSAAVVRSVYQSMISKENMLDNRKAALSLHFAIRELRERSTVVMRNQILIDPTVWARYIHVGL